MTIDETRQKILESDEFVLSESKKLQTFYVLKKEIRYGHSRNAESHTESVAEHIYALNCLTNYFLPLENLERDWDKLKILNMILVHDIDEIETGDIVSYKKTEADYNKETDARTKVISKLPESLQSNIKDFVDFFEAQDTIEAKFVRALDKFEPMIHCFSEEGRKTLHTNKFDLKRRYEFTKDFIEPFPIMSRFEDVLNTHFVDEKYYYSNS